MTGRVITALMTKIRSCSGAGIGSAVVLLLSACHASDASSGSSPGVFGESAAAGKSSVGGASTSASGGVLDVAGASGKGTSTAGAADGGTSGASAGATGGAGGALGESGGSPSAGGVSGANGFAGASTSAGGTGGAEPQPGVLVVGRSAPGTNGALRFSWPGVSIRARFSGTQVSMTLNDGNNKNRFSVVIDGGTPQTVTTSSAQTLPLASGLVSGTHELLVWRNTEASPGGVTQFNGLTGFGSGGALLAPPPAPSRSIEVIGDSLSVGAGVEGTSTSCNPSIDAFTNNYLAYGSVAARALDADVVTIAWSGIGVYRSYGGSAPTMPERYDYAVPNDDTAWNFSTYQPNAVVINLGTNDFSAGNPGQAYIDAYVSFVQHVRSKYAHTKFILIDMYGGDRLTAINSVVATLKTNGEEQVEVLSFSSVPNNNTACNQHPNTAAQAAMGALLAARLKSSLVW